MNQRIRAFVGLISGEGCDIALEETEPAVVDKLGHDASLGRVGIEVAGMALIFLMGEEPATE